MAQPADVGFLMIVNYAYMGVLVAAASGLFCLSITAGHRLDKRKSRYLRFLCLSTGWWCFWEGILFLGFGARINLYLTYLQYPGIVFTAPLLLFLIMTGFGLDHHLKKNMVISLVGVSLLFLLVIWTTRYHHLYYTIPEPGQTPGVATLGLSQGPVYYLLAIYCWSLVLITSMLLVRQCLFSNRLHLKQGLVVLSATAVVWACNILHVIGIDPLPGLDLTPVSFGLVAAALALAMVRYQFLDLAPVAREAIFQSLEDPVLVLDIEGRVVDLNPAAVLLARGRESEIIGTGADRVLGDFQPEGSYDPRTKEASLIDCHGRRRDYDVLISDLHGPKEAKVGRLLVLRDITARKRLEERLKNLAETDSLTNLHNRRHFHEQAGKEISRAQRYGHPLSLLVMDLDEFKQINDTHGHPVGDKVLKAVSEVLLETVRQSDIPARIGGEEFALLCPETDIQRAGEVAERIRLAVDELRLEDKGRRIRISLSLGISLLGEDEGLVGLMQRADRALYQAKQQGRNRVCRARTPAA